MAGLFFFSMSHQGQVANRGQENAALTKSAKPKLTSVRVRHGNKIKPNFFESYRHRGLRTQLVKVDGKHISWPTLWRAQTRPPETTWQDIVPITLTPCPFALQNKARWTARWMHETHAHGHSKYICILCTCLRLFKPKKENNMSTFPLFLGVLEKGETGKMWSEWNQQW